MADTISPEMMALLEAIAVKESDGQWNVIYGGDTFSDYSDHPRQYVTIEEGPNKGKKSSAAGKFQITASTYDTYAPMLGITDFSPESQLKLAAYLAALSYEGDIDTDLKSGDPAKLTAIARALSGQWTSLPGGIEQTQSVRAFLRNYKEAAAKYEAASPGNPPPQAPATVSAETATPPHNSALAAINAATKAIADNPALAYLNNASFARAPSYSPPAPWAALAAQAKPAGPAPARPPINVQYPGSVTLNVPVPQLLTDVRNAEPGVIGAATFFAKDKDAALTNLIADKLPPYVKFDPATNSLTFNDLGNASTQAALAGGVKTGFPKIDAVFAPYLEAAQKGMTTPLPLPRDARPAPKPIASFGTSYTPASTLTTLQASTPAAAKPAPWEVPLPAAARTMLAKPYSVSTATLAPSQAVTPTGAITSADMMRAISDPNYKPPVSARVETPPPAAAPRPVAPPPVFNWTTSSRLAALPPTPAQRPGTAKPAPDNKGLFGLSPMGMLSGFLASAIKPPGVAPRGQFGQPLAVGGTYRNGAVWAANGSGYGGSLGQSTWGLKPGERVYDINTGEWGLKVGQPVSWSGSSSGNTSTATGTFKGTSTGNTYTVGKIYTNGNGSYQAMPDGTFKRV